MKKTFQKRDDKKIEPNFMNEMYKLKILRTVAACLGQMQMTEEQSKVVAAYFQLNDQECLFLQTVPHKSTLNGTIPSDPLLYRLHEVIQSIPYVIDCNYFRKKNSQTGFRCLRARIEGDNS